MGRPRKTDSERRTAQLNLHLTADEEKKILEWAAASGMFPPEWIRQKIFTGRFPPVRQSPIETAVYQELRKIGVNLNQGTHKLNAGEFPRNYLTLQLELLAMLNKLCKVLLADRHSKTDPDP
ncbi:MAG TPA: hypothetical protein VG737_07085 [Cyclobacteriaceae bacterium]|nr:hypothetical protein [Cyclobacteriaceae bacterium]